MQKQIAFKLLAIFIVGLMVLIPIGMVEYKVYERQSFMDDAPHPVRIQRRPLDGVRWQTAFDVTQVLDPFFLVEVDDSMLCAVRLGVLGEHCSLDRRHRSWLPGDSNGGVILRWTRGARINLNQNFRSARLIGTAIMAPTLGCYWLV